MDYYYGVIYFKNGTKLETGSFSGSGAEQQCERATAELFDMKMRTATHDFFKPTRYEVKKK